MNTYAKFAILTVAIIGTLAWLAAGGINESKTYYMEIAELQNLSTDAAGKRGRLRVGGDVEDGSIIRTGREVRFTLRQNTRQLKVVYDSIEPLPDTFKGGAQALADGRLAPDGVFHANKIQAKCASKYEAKPVQKPAINEKRAAL